MKLAIDYERDESMGDHAVEVSVALEYIPGETIEDLIKRADRDRLMYPTNRIIVRKIAEANDETK